ncbi:MAG: ABC transporter permease [Acidimicrobiia bacterium]
MAVTIYIVKRLLISLLLLLVVSFLIYGGVRSTVDPTARLSASKDPQAKIREKQRLGLDKPLLVQYKNWLSGVVKGDFGKGDVDRVPVMDKISAGFFKSLELAFWGAIFAIILGISFGVISAIRRNKPADYLLSAFSYVGIAVPVFAFAYILMNIFAIWLPHKFGQSQPWFYTSGLVDNSYGRAADGLWNFESIKEYFRHMIMPIMTLTIQLIAGWSRYQRGEMIESLQSDYIRTAHAKGMSRRRVYFRHAFRNSEIPMVNVISLDIAFLLQGLVITETIFTIPGMGSVFVRAFQLGDATTLCAWVLVTAVIVILANLFADLMLPIIDPRIRTR